MPAASPQSSATKSPPARSSPAPLDTRQIQGDHAGSGENAGRISNRPLEEEGDNQKGVPPRGDGKEGGHA